MESTQHGAAPTDAEQAAARVELLERTRLHLQAALPGLVGMRGAYSKVRAAIAVVARQVGRAKVKAKGGHEDDAAE